MTVNMPNVHMLPTSLISVVRSSDADQKAGLANVLLALFRPRQSVLTNVESFPVASALLGVDNSGAASLSAFIANTVAVLENVYQVRVSNEAREYLNSQPHLVSMMVDAKPHIDAAFPEKRLDFRVHTDYETGRRVLLVTVIVDLSPEVAFEYLQVFDRSWLVDNIERANDMLIIDLDFV